MKLLLFTLTLVSFLSIILRWLYIRATRSDNKYNKNKADKVVSDLRVSHDKKLEDKS
jgi:hypothetical protein